MRASDLFPRGNSGYVYRLHNCKLYFRLRYIIFGSLATLLGAIFARALAKLPRKLMFITTLPTVFANALIVPFVIMYAYGSPESYWFLFVTVAAGELVTATGVGTLLYYQLEKRKFLYGL